MNMSVINFEKPQRQSVFGILFFLLLSIRKSIAAFWPILVLYVFKGNSAEFFSVYGYLILSILGVIWLVHSYLSYRHFFFYIENNEFILKKGYLKKVIVAIPFDKIISINLNQNLLQQLIGVVELEIDSAGSKTKEVKISALKKAVANELEKLLSARKMEFSEKEDREELALKDEPSTVFQYDMSDLIKVGLTRNHLRGLAIVAAFGFNIFQQIDEVFDQEIENAARQTEAFFVNSDIAVFVSLGILLVLISFIISMIETILFYFNLHLKKTDKAFSLSSGLLKRKNVTIPFSRVQAFRRSINPLQKLAGISTITLSQANSSETNQKTGRVNIPGCNAEIFGKTHSAVFRNNHSEQFEELFPHKAFLRRRVIFGAVFPALLSLLLLFLSVWFTVLSGCIFLFGIWVSWLSWRKRSYEINDRFLKVNSGTFARKLTIIELFKPQSISLNQSFFQRHRNTGTINLVLAGTSVSVNEIPMEKAYSIKNYLLYKIESSERNWM